MLRKQKKQQRNLAGKCSLSNNTSHSCSNKFRGKKDKKVSIKKQQHFNQLIREINKFKDRVIQLESSKNVTPNKSKQKTNHQLTSNFCDKTFLQNQSSVQTYQKYLAKEYQKSPIISHYTGRFPNQTSATIPINLIIQNGNSNKYQIRELNKKIKKLQQKNNFLSQQKMILQHKLFYQQRSKNQLKQILLKQNQPNKSFMNYYIKSVNIKSPKKEKKQQSPVKKDQNLLDSICCSKSPYNIYKLDDSRQSKLQRQYLRKENIQGNSSSSQKHPRTKKNLYWSRGNNYSNQTQNYLKLQNQPNKHFNTTIANPSVNSYIKKYNNIQQSNFSQITDQRKLTTKVQSSMKSFNIAVKQDSNQSRLIKGSQEMELQIQKTNKIQQYPRITFSKEIVAPRKNSETQCTNQKLQFQKITMLQEYFQRLITFSRVQKNKQKKDIIRKQMSQIAIEMHDLRKKLNLQCNK